MKHESTTEPAIFDFLDVVQFLQSHFEWRKSVDRRFSYAAWSDELGLGSKTLLRFILQRKRSISPRTAEILKSNLRLGEKEARYLDVLISYGRAKNEEQKQAYATLLLKEQRARYSQREVSPADAAHHFLGPVVLTLLTFRDFNPTAERIANLLGQDEATILAVLSEFETRGLISSGDDGKFLFDQNAFRIPESPKHDALRQFYLYWIDRSKSAIELPVETRKFRNLKFALSPEEYDQATERMNDFALSLLSHFHSDTLQGRRLYMFSGALFPISADFGLIESQGPERDPKAEIQG